MKNLTVYYPHPTLIFILLGLFISMGFANSVPTTKPLSYKVEKDALGKYWLVDPKGNQFLSLGINNINPTAWNPRPNSDYYDAINSLFDGNFERWEDDTIKLLHEHGFNTLGAWSDGRIKNTLMYSTVCLYVNKHKKDRCLDVLRPRFSEKVRANTLKTLSQHKNLDQIFGVFLDNEMSWFGKTPWDNIPTYTLIEAAISMNKDDPARIAVKQFFISRYKTVENLSKSWDRPLATWDDLDLSFLSKCLNNNTQKDRNDFTQLVAEKYFSTATKIVRELLPGKLILGVRFAGISPEPVIAACGKYCDVVSFNNYQSHPQTDKELLTKYWIWSGHRPLMITEYSWRSEENSSGNPNSAGAGSVVKTQAQRAENYRIYVESTLAYPMVVGTHWFEFADQSPQGRFDGENSNYGIVNLKHKPYRQLLNAMAQTHTGINEIHAKSSLTPPQMLPKPRPVIFEPGQHPDRPPFIDLIYEQPIAPPAIFEAPDADLNLNKENLTATINFDTGHQWGCGVTFFGPKKLAVHSGPKHTTDLDGYSILIMDAEMPTDIAFEIFVDEAGVASPYEQSYNIQAGDDGESFTFMKTYLGQGKRHIYQFELANLQPRLNWGNQNGLRRVNLMAMKGIAMYLRGDQGMGEIKIHSLKLSR
jgi:hypothetical protein